MALLKKKFIEVTKSMESLKSYQDLERDKTDLLNFVIAKNKMKMIKYLIEEKGAVLSENNVSGLTQLVRKKNVVSTLKYLQDKNIDIYYGNGILVLRALGEGQVENALYLVKNNPIQTIVGINILINAVLLDPKIDLFDNKYDEIYKEIFKRTSEESLEKLTKSINEKSATPEHEKLNRYINKLLLELKIGDTKKETNTNKMKI